MRFIVGCVQFYTSLFSAYIERNDIPDLPEPEWTDGTYT